MTVLCLAILAAGGAGLLVVRAASSIARVAAWLVLLWCAAIAHLATVEFAELPARAAVAGVGASGSGHAVLVAAAAAGPRARDLVLRWDAPLDGGAPVGSLGGEAHLPRSPLAVDPTRVQVRALGEATAGRPVVLAVEVPHLQERTAAALVVRDASGAVVRQEVAIAPGGAVDGSFVPTVGGSHEVELTFPIDGHRVTARGVLAVADAPAVLVIEPSGVAAAALRAQGIRVREAVDLPPDFRQAAAVVLGRRLGVSEQRALADAVLDGTGLFVLAPAFGLPGEPLRALLPVRPAPPAGDGAGGGGIGSEPQPPAPTTDDTAPPTGDTSNAANVSSQPIEVDKRAIAIVLVVDRSGSMGTPLPNGATKMSYAKTSALRTAQALGPGDAAAVVTFGDKDAGRLELPLTPATDRAAVHAGVARLAHNPGERTFLLGGLRVAADVLAASNAAVKHVVVLTDGEFEIGESVALHDLAKRMRSEGRITLSVVSILDAATEQSFKIEAELLTRAGGGQFLPVDDPAVVPVLVTAEVTRALSRVGRAPRDGAPTDAPTPAPDRSGDAPAGAAAAAGGRVPVRAVAPSALLAPVPDARGWPSLGAAVAGTAPLDARVLLVAGDQGWPLLAFGNRGLGRVGAFAADVCGAAGDEFRADPAFGARLAQWLQAVLPAVPLRAGRPLVTEVTIAPLAPTLRDRDLLRGVSGSEPIVAPTPRGASSAIVRYEREAASRSAWTLVVALVLLLAVERVSGPWWIGRRAAPGRMAEA